MKLFVKDGILVAFHLDTDEVTKDDYNSNGNSGVKQWPYSGSTTELHVGMEAPFDVLAYTKQRRYEVETGGITIDGQSVATDRDTQNRYNQKVTWFDKNPNVQYMNWNGPDGFVKIPRDYFILMASIAGTFVQLCFDKQMQVEEALGNKSTHYTDQDIDNIFATVSTAFSSANPPTTENATGAASGGTPAAGSTS